MIRLSTKYVFPLSACLLVALIPVLVHSYVRAEIDDCNASWALLPESKHASVAEASRDVWMRERFQSYQWHEGSFFTDGVRFDFSIVRSYDAKRLYHRPENSLVEHAVVKRRDVEWLQAGSEALPIHRAYYDDTNPEILVSYLLVYRSAPVDNPYWTQLDAAVVELLRGRLPMTLFLIQAHGSPRNLSEIEKTEREWLLKSWKKYHSACMY